MSSQETSDHPAVSEGIAEVQSGETDMASKLSKELSNWRRKRGASNGRLRDEGPSGKPQLSEPARTIKVRGHETLVIRKGKLAGKARTEATSPRD